MEKKRIQFITCNRTKDTYGITSGLFNSASFVVNFLNENGFEATLTPVADSNEVDRVVTKYDPEVVVIEALWVPPAKFQELLKLKRHRQRRWIVRVHSKAPFLANEGMATSWMHQYTLLDEGVVEIAPNTMELTKQLASAFPYGKFIHLPNVYFAEEFHPVDKPRDGKYIDIGCFGAIRPMKNTYQQALAAIDFAERNDKILRFHCNTTRVEQRGENVVKNIRALFDGSPHEFVEHMWYKHREFLQAASAMDVGMQVSFSESFNIVTADFVTAGVPIVASDDIEWMPWLLKVSPTSHEGMVKRIGRAYRNRKFYRFLQKIHLKIYNAKAKITWLAALN